VPPSYDASPSQNTIRIWLSSEDPRLEAWGAHDALVTGDRTLTPDLLSLASHWLPISPRNSDTSPQPQLSSEQKDERNAMAAVLDALVQMNVTVPAETLRTLAPDFGNAVAILLARLPNEDANPLSVDFFRSPPENGLGLQYVSAALLALHPSFGFAGELLASIRVRATMYVILPGSAAPGRGYSGSCGAYNDQPRANWPVTGQYALTKLKSDGATPVVVGIDPIYAIREQSTNYREDFCGVSEGLYLGPNERVRLVAELLGVPSESIPWQTEVVKSIEFQSPQQVDDAILAFVAEQQEKYQETADALAERDLDTLSDTRASLPELDLELDDMRGQSGDPLVKLLTLPPRVEWASSPWWAGRD